MFHNTSKHGDFVYTKILLLQGYSNFVRSNNPLLSRYNSVGPHIVGPLLRHGNAYSTYS